MNALLFVFEISLISGGNLLSCQRDLNCGFIGLEKSTTSASGMSAAEQTENKCSQIATFVIRATSDLFPADSPLITCRDHKICSTPKNLTTL